MSKRSVQITLVNNTPFVLTEYEEWICHGSWSNVTGSPPPTISPSPLSLPATVQPNAMVQWTSQDAEDGIFVGTEGWAKYTCPQPLDSSDPTSELVWIHWDNPYVWSSRTNPIDFKTSLSDVSVPCGSSSGWPPSSPGTFSNIVPGTKLATQLFGVSSSGSGPPAWDWGSSGAGPVFDVIVDWQGLLVQGLIDAEHDINLTFTLGLRQIGSVNQSIRHFYDGSKGLRALSVKAQQPSLKKVMGF